MLSRQKEFHPLALCGRSGSLSRNHSVWIGYPLTEKAKAAAEVIAGELATAVEATAAAEAAAAAKAATTSTAESATETAATAATTVEAG